MTQRGSRAGAPLPGLRRACTLGLIGALATGACHAGSPERPPPSPKAFGPPSPAEVFGDNPLASSLGLVLETGAGEVPCEIEPARTPRAAALFVGLATGRAPWLDPATGRIVKRPLYRDLPFARVVEGMLVQSGCPVGDATGHPGYRIEVEPSGRDAALLEEPGALVLARYTSPPLREDPSPPPPGHLMGSQFAVTLVPMPHLAGQVTVLGRCRELSTVRTIAASEAPDERPRLRRIRLR